MSKTGGGRELCLLFFMKLPTQANMPPKRLTGRAGGAPFGFAVV